MALLNQLLSERDLAQLSNDQREFLVQRIDHVLDTSKEIRQIVAKELPTALNALGKKDYKISVPKSSFR